MGKLVRDGIPQIIEAAGDTPVVRVLSEEKYAAALLAKLQEEVDELVAASPEHRLEEAADVYEVLRAVTASLGLDADALHAAARAKRIERGGFTERIWLES